MTQQELEDKIRNTRVTIGILSLSNIVLVISLWLTSDALRKCNILLGGG